MESRKKNFIPKNDLTYKNLVELSFEIKNNRYELNCDFVLPQNPKFSSFGNKIAFCQIVNSWFQKNPRSQVRIYDNYFPDADAEIAKVIAKLVKEGELHFLLVLSHGIKSKILGYSKKAKDYTNFFVRPLEDRLIYDYRELSKLSEKRAFLSEYFQIHPDFFDKDFFQFNLTFYQKYGNQYFIKNEESINETSKKLFHRIQAMSEETTFNWVRALQIYFYEIFDNTYKWGRNNLLKIEDDNKPIEKSNRLFFISSKNLINRSLSKEDLFGLDVHLHNFATTHSRTSGWGKETKLLELSILDNGIGIVQAFKRQNIKTSQVNIQDEYAYLLEAFKMGTTSDLTYKGRLRGIGLNKVIQNAKDVFLIIRTGHLYLFRDFSVHPYQPEDEFYLFDASVSTMNTMDSLSRIKKYPWAEGTLFTFIIPLSK